MSTMVVTMSFFLCLSHAASYFFRFLENGIILEDLTEDSISAWRSGRDQITIYGSRFLPAIFAAQGS